MNANCVQSELEIPIRDAISRTRFAPHSNNLLISSWDLSLQLYYFDASVLRLQAPSEAALLDCRFQDDSVAFTATSDGFIRSMTCILELLTQWVVTTMTWQHVLDILMKHVSYSPNQIYLLLFFIFWMGGHTR